MIRLSKACVDFEELLEIEKVFKQTLNFGLGIHVNEFENHLKKFINTDAEIICVNTGTAALHISLQALNLPIGSEVLVPSITFVASYSAISAAGHIPVSCDVVFPDAHIDLDDAEKRITSRTKAIMPVAYSGTDFQRNRLYEFAKKHSLRVVEDDAHAFGSLTENNQIFGSEGDIICFSFDGIKNITCGEGGAVVTRDKELAHKIRVIRSLGIEQDVGLRYQGKRAWEYDVKVQGFRYHMSNINAAIGVAQLPKIHFFQEKRAKLVEKYNYEIDCNLKNIITPTQASRKTDCLHIYSCLLPKGVDRIKIRKIMSESGIETGFHYAPNHLHSYYKSNYFLPVSEELGARLITLPLHPDLAEETPKKVITLLKQALEQVKTWNKI